MTAPLTIAGEVTDAAGGLVGSFSAPLVPPIPPDPPTAVGGSVLKLTGETMVQACQRLDGIYGDAGHKWTPRVFLTSPPSAGQWGSAIPNDRPVVVSFKADAAAILAGTFDAQLLAWWNAAPADHEVYWSYWHEAEDDFTTAAAKAQYIAAWRHLAELQYTVNATNLYATLILMDWTLDAASGRNWRDWYPGASYLRVLAWDQYGYDNGNGGLIAESVKQAPGNRPSAATSHGEGLRYAVGEFGCKFEVTPTIPDSTRATWLEQTGAAMKANDAAFVTLFDSNVGGTFNIEGHPTLVAAWRSVVTG